MHPETQTVPEVRAIREALGAVAIGTPASYWLAADTRGDWHVRREGDAGDQRFVSEEDALRFARLAVVRCASYRLHIRHRDGSVVDELFNWPPTRNEPRT